MVFAASSLTSCTVSRALHGATPLYQRRSANALPSSATVARRSWTLTLRWFTRSLVGLRYFASPSREASGTWPSGKVSPGGRIPVPTLPPLPPPDPGSVLPPVPPPGLPLPSSPGTAVGVGLGVAAGAELGARVGSAVAPAQAARVRTTRRPAARGRRDGRASGLVCSMA